MIFVILVILTLNLMIDLNNKSKVCHAYQSKPESVLIIEYSVSAQSVNISKNIKVEVFAFNSEFPNFQRKLSNPIKSVKGDNQYQFELKQKVPQTYYICYHNTDKKTKYIEFEYYYLDDPDNQLLVREGELNIHRNQVVKLIQLVEQVFNNTKWYVNKLKQHQQGIESQESFLKYIFYSKFFILIIVLYVQWVIIQKLFKNEKQFDVSDI